MIRAFLFDLDETLVDAEPQHRAATRAMLEALGHPPDALRDAFHPPAGAPIPDLLADPTGARTLDLVAAYRARLGVAQSEDEMLALRHAAFLAALDETPAAPMPGARALVEACRARGATAVVSSGHRDDVLATLASARLLPLFATIVSGDDVVAPKPDPEPYLAAASRLGVKPAECLAFEDSVRGVASARAAGCRVVAVPNARSTRPEAVKAADLVLGSLTEALPLDDLLARLGTPP